MAWPSLEGPGTDEMPQFPPNLLTDSDWTLDDFHSLVEVGKGKDTIIYSAICPRMGNRKVALKQYDKTKVQPTKYRAIKREIAMMLFFARKKLPSVVNFHAAFHDDANIYIVMEYCGGGDLLEKLLREKKAMNEKKVALEVALPCLTVLQKLHDLRIIHRDIKLENIFIDDAGRVKLGDFGLTMSMRQESAISPVGTVEYMAPEVVALPPVDLVMSGKIRASDIPPTNEKVDIWALGVTIYELVTGRLPFEGADKPEIKRNITANNLAAFPSFLSPQCQSFIRAMLTYRVSERPSCAELLRHPYITMYTPSPKPQFPGIIALHAYTPGASAAAGGSDNGTSRSSSLSGLPPGRPASYREVLSAGVIAHAAPNPGTPRSPGGSYVPVTVTKGRVATSMHGSPSMYGGGDGSFSARGQHQQHELQEAGAPAVSARKLSFRSLLGRSQGNSKGAALPGAGEERLQQRSSSTTSQPSYNYSPLGAGSAGRAADRSSVMQNIRALFTSKKQKAQHQPIANVEEEDSGAIAAAMDASFTGAGR